MSARADQTGLFVEVVAVTALNDPPAAMNAYHEAILASIAGDDSKYREAMDALGKDHPDTYAGRQGLVAKEGAGMGNMATGVLAAVAIPAFMKYVQKSKASEAQVFVNLLADGAAQYAAEKGRYPDVSTAVTPPAGSCCQGEETTCAPNASLWADKPWTDLQFSADDPHRYSYQYESKANGTAFVVRAIGDLDCDGTYSTFEMQGAMDKDGAPQIDRFVTRENELE